MRRLIFPLLFCVSTPALAQNAASGSPRVQGTPDGYGDPVQVTVVSSNGSDLSGTTATQVQGNVAADAVNVGNPVLVGCYVEASPTNAASIDGDRGSCKVDGRGYLWTNIGIGGNSALLSAAMADAATNSPSRMYVEARGMAYNGATWDRLRGDTTGLWAQGNVAHDAADSGNPVKIGGIANNTAPVAVAAADRTNAWLGLNGQQVVAGGTTVTTAYSAATGPVAMTGPGDAQARPLLTLGTVSDGTTAAAMRGDTNGVPSTPGLSSLTWSYSNGATGILSNTTTAVTIKTAAGASIRNYIDSCTINTTAFGAAVPLAIRDGAAGTVLFAVNVPTAGFLQPVNIVFQQPLRGTANTLLEVVTTTANTTGEVWVNCQGHTGV